MRFKEIDKFKTAFNLGSLCFFLLISKNSHSDLLKSVHINTNVVSSNPAQARCTLCDKVCQWLATGRWFSLGTPISSTNKTYRHDMAEILLKVVLNTITIILTHSDFQLQELIFR